MGLKFPDVALFLLQRYGTGNRVHKPVAEGLLLCLSPCACPWAGSLVPSFTKNKLGSQASPSHNVGQGSSRQSALGACCCFAGLKCGGELAWHAQTSSRKRRTLLSSSHRASLASGLPSAGHLCSEASPLPAVLPVGRPPLLTALSQIECHELAGRLSGSSSSQWCCCWVSSLSSLQALTSDVSPEQTLSFAWRYSLGVFPISPCCSFALLRSVEACVLLVWSSEEKQTAWIMVASPERWPFASGVWPCQGSGFLFALLWEILLC